MAISEQAIATGKQLETLSINTIRTLAIDAVQQANSGHPGAPMGLAPVAYSLWQKLSALRSGESGLAESRPLCLVEWACVHAVVRSFICRRRARRDHSGKPTGKPAVSLDDIKHFRQIDSNTPGHPEYGMTTGVETTTGPLGQGVGNSVGMAIAAKWLGARFNRPDFDLFDYNIYAMCGDGDMMEGVASEAASLAGHLKLSNLCWIYDDNHVTLDGPADWSFSEDVDARFRAYGWNVSHVTDANDLDALGQGVRDFSADQRRPTLIVVNSHIGYGSPHKQDNSAAHGEPLGEEEVKLVKKIYGWPEDAKFLVPDGVLENFQRESASAAQSLHRQWEKHVRGYMRSSFPISQSRLNRMQHRELPEGWDKNLPTFPADAKGMATRESSGKVLNVMAQTFRGWSAARPI